MKTNLTLALQVAAVGTMLAMLACANPRYCEGNPDNDCKVEPGACSRDEHCSAPTAICDEPNLTCVQCTAEESAGCTGATPLCIANRCAACTMHAQCGESEVCLEAGACAASDDVAYLDSDRGSDTADCKRDTPCKTVAKGLATGRDIIKFTGTFDESVTLDSIKRVFVAAPGAKLTRTAIGSLLELRGSAELEISDLEISGALGANSGISLALGNTALLTLRRAKILNNAGGGISINGGSFDIVNTLVVDNGGSSSSFGGIKIDSIVSAGLRRLDFSTITGNIGPDGTPTGVLCATVTVPLTFSGNIVYDNRQDGTRTQVGGPNCSWKYSNVGQGAVPGSNNINAAPMFVDAARKDFHLTTGSPCKDKADPSATLERDFEGDARPQGAVRDIGADEIRE